MQNIRSVILMLIVLLILVLVYIFTKDILTVSEKKVQTPPLLWSVEMDQLKRILISIPSEDMTESWIKHNDNYWYFEKGQEKRVDMERWGGGVPLLVSGPRAKRIVAHDVKREELKNYGLERPFIFLKITLINEETLDVLIGDQTPGGDGYYIRLIDSSNIYIIDHTWVKVIEKLVREPPYPNKGSELQNP